MQKTFSIFVLVFTLLQISCYEPTDGCLDIEATNFDASADESCENCCTYPKLKLSISHQIEIEGSAGQDSCINHSADSVMTNVIGNNFKLDDIYFYLSDFRLTLSTGEIATVTDSIQLIILDDNISLEEIDTTVVDDFALVKRSAFSYTLGEFIAPGNYEKIQFKVGITPRLNTANPDTLSSTHPLAISKDSMHTNVLNTGYVMQRFEVVRDTLSLSDVYDYEILDPFSNLVEISLPYQFTAKAGFDVTLPIKVNYTKWLSGIDFVTESDTAIKTKIVNNTAEAFSILE